jgi:hypothetical protein
MMLSSAMSRRNCLSPVRELSLTLRRRLRLGKACAIIDTTSPVSHKSNPYSMVFECSSRTPRITNIDMPRAEHDVWKGCCYFLSCLAFAAAASAQPAESESPSEHDDRTAAPPPTPGTVEEVPPAHNGTAATPNSLSICQMIGSARAAVGLVQHD